MKKLYFTVSFYILFSILFSSQLCLAASSGRMTISGIAMTDKDIIIYASQYYANNASECYQTDEWWPTGTQYVFWFPREKNRLLYAHFLSAYYGNIPVWINNTLKNELAFGNGVHCQINVPMGVSMGK